MKWDLLNEKSDRLFKKWINGQQKLLDDKALDDLLRKMREEEYLRKKIRQQKRFDYRKAYGRMIYPGKKRFMFDALKVAAVVSILLGGGMAFYFYTAPQNMLPEGSEATYADIKPGGYKAFLQMHNGKKMELGRDTGIIQEENGACIRMDSVGLNYEAGVARHADELCYNTLVVPKGGEFSLILSDGTKIWLNSDSELKYPVRFSGERREVYISGEAYFDVQKQEGKPFVVKTSLGSITVLGTKFNVCNYLEKGQMVTTLVSGSVLCSMPDGRKALLKPNQQLIVGKNAEEIVRDVDPSYSTGWKDGMFLFEDERLEDIMEQLARWYDVQVFYSCDAVKELHFTGDLSRFKNIGTFLEMFEKSAGIRITLNGRAVFVGM